MRRKRKYISIFLTCQLFCLSSPNISCSASQADEEDSIQVSILLGRLNRKDPSAANAAVSALERLDADTITKSLPALRRALKSDDTYTRNITMWLLGKVNRDAASSVFQELVNGLKDKSAVVRASAVSSLGQLARNGTRESLQSVVSSLRDPDPYVRQTAAEALGDIGLPAASAINDLMKTAQDSEWLVRASGLHALGRIAAAAASPDGLSTIRRALNDEDGFVRLSAVQALGRLGAIAKEAVVDLQKTLRDSRRSVRVESMTSLGRLANAGVEEARLAIEDAMQSSIGEIRFLAADVFWRTSVPVQKALPLLLALLSDRTSETRRAAVQSLGGLRPATSDVINRIRLMLKDKDASVREQSTRTLGNWGDAAKDAIPEIRELLKDTRPEVRRSAAVAAASLRASDPDTIAALTKLLTDDVESVRHAAVGSLAVLGQTPANTMPILLRLLQDPVVEMRRAVLTTLGRMGPAAKDAVPDLTLLLKDSNEQVRLETVNAFRNMASAAAQAVPSLAQIIVDEREKINIREAVANALGSIGPSARDSIPSLKIAMRSENEQVRFASVQAFAKIGPPSEVLGLLADDLKSKDSSDRRTALQGLVIMGPAGKDMVTAVTAALKDNDEDIRNRAASVLGNMGHYAKDAIAPLTGLLQGPRPSGSAAQAIARIAVAAQDEGATELIPALEGAINILAESQFKEQASTVRRALRALNDLKRAHEGAGSAWWKYSFITIGGLLLLNIVLVVMAIPSRRVRRLIFDPNFSYLFGKHWLIPLMIRFVDPLRIGLFRYYRKNLETSQLVTRWQNHKYIPQSVQVAKNTSPVGVKDGEWQSVLEDVLHQPTGGVWLLIGKSGLGKTALLENWAIKTLELNRIPIFIPLGGELSPSQEAKAILEQHGDIMMEPGAVLNLLKEGPFVVLLDGLNEDRHSAETKEFVRQLAKRNHVIVSGQIEPRWDNLELSNIDLKPFGREQLLELLKEEKRVNEVLAAGYLADLAKLPHTAQLLSDYISKNDRLPALRLDIYRDLRKGFEGNTEILNLEALAWNLFKLNRKAFAPNGDVSKSFCDLAVTSGILTKGEQDYQFRHELIQRFFVACYLDRQDRKPLAEWYEEVQGGLGPGYWSDAIELWSEFYAERAVNDPSERKLYHDFLKETSHLSPKLFAQRLYPQIFRLQQSGVLEKDPSFFEWAANAMAPAAAQS